MSQKKLKDKKTQSNLTVCLQEFAAAFFNSERLAIAHWTTGGWNNFPNTFPYMPQNALYWNSPKAT